MCTVHVNDACRALWHLSNHGNSGDVFNLADKSNTSKTLLISEEHILIYKNHYLKVMVFVVVVVAVCIFLICSH